MDFRIGYRRPLRTVWLLRKKRQRIRLCIVAAIAVVATVAAMTWEQGPAAIKTSAAAAPGVQLAVATAAPAAAATTRRVYPYSIVPGGVATRDDLQRRVSTDAVVARHYATFDVKKAHALAVPKARAVYVSYRKGDKVFWTAHKVMLAAGETVLSDGASEIRGRCGNRISEKAQLPVAMNEPTEAELDASMNVAMDPDADGGLQNASFGLDDALPLGNASQFQSLAAATPADQAPASPYTRTAMPAMPAFPNGMPGASGMQATRFLAATSGPSNAFGPTTEGSATVAPDASTGTPVSAADPVAVLPAAITTTPTVPGTSDTVTVPAAGTPATGSPAASTPVVPPKTALPEGEVPEPATLWLSGLAFAAMLLAGRRKTSRPHA